jgi:tetratricopeptide (TPR) repeat protein
MIEPKNTDVWYHKACILEKMKDYEQALEALETLVLDNTSINSWYNKANYFKKHKKEKEALEAYNI